MAQSTTPAPAPATFVYDTKKVSDKVAELEAYYKPFSGKPGYNPHFALHKLATLVAGEKNEANYNAIMSFEKKEPVAPGCKPLPVTK